MYSYSFLFPPLGECGNAEWTSQVQREMLLDYIHGGGDFQRSFGFGAAPESVRPRDHIEFKQAWGQLFTKYNDAAHTIQDGLPRIYPEPD